jgi:DNA-binding LytR/AlgR family response regulator
MVSSQIHVGSKTYLSLEQVVLIKAAFSYSEILLSDGRKLLVTTNLSTIQRRFGNTMIRVHRSYLLNPHFIKELRSSSVLTCLDVVCPMSRRMRGNLAGFSLW